MRGAFVFDADRCTGCQACELACQVENDLGERRSWRTVLTFNERGQPGVPVFHLSLACNHCLEPACMHACPAQAYERDRVTGAVLVDATRCVGCGYCAWACPYGAPRFEPERGVMGKCTFCAHRLREGLKPACAQYCPTGALDYGMLAESDLSDAIEGLPRTGLGPAIRALPARESFSDLSRTARAGAGSAPSVALETFGAEPDGGIGLQSEWSLAAFTFLLATLFSVLAASVTGSAAVPPVAFAAGVALATLLSLAHLGRRDRAWRAILNLRRSWLSREVAGFAIFAGAGIVSLVLDGGPGLAVGGVAVAVGLGMLLSADQVYRPVYSGLTPILDDGGSLLTGVYLAGLLMGDVRIAGFAGALKLVGVARALRAHGDMKLGTPSPTPTVTLGTRTTLGLAVPALTWTLAGVPLPVWALAIAFIGEAVARAGFYGRLRIVSPERQIRVDVAARLAASCALAVRRT
jgi:DMSO reductase iron-sulfur subunit